MAPIKMALKRAILSKGSNLAQTLEPRVGSKCLKFFVFAQTVLSRPPSPPPPPLLQPSLSTPFLQYALFFILFYFFAPAVSGGQRSVSVVRVCGPRRREPRGHRARELGGGLCRSPRGWSCREQAHHRRHQRGYRCVCVGRT